MNNSEFEKNLKNKMDELASSVDCFDKIAKRAYPEENSDFSDCEYTVSDLENITGRRSRFRLASVIALAAAVALVIFVLPENLGFLNNVFSDKGNKSDIKAYRSLIAEIKEETENHEYTYFDCTLKEYIENDLLLSPLYSCPFEVKNDENINVRVYTRICGEYPTNQIYAVQYEGKYEDGNILAVADSKAKFTEEELSEHTASNETDFPTLDTDTFFEVENLICNKDSAENEMQISAASFTYDCIYKLDDKIYNTASSIIYYVDPTKSVVAYDYDIISAYMSKDIIKSFDPSVFENDWNTALYNNGSSAFADKSESVKTFNRSDFLESSESLYITDKMCYTEPFEEFPIKPELGIEFTVYSNISSAPLPAPVIGDSFRIYLPTTLENPRLNYSKSTSVEGGTVDFEPKYCNSTYSPFEDQENFTEAYGESVAEKDRLEEIARKLEEYRQSVEAAQAEAEMLSEQAAAQDIQEEIEKIQKLQEEIQIASADMHDKNAAESEAAADAFEKKMNEIIAK
ncbi:MAG: PCRF domain-containing protein [Ruminococcus sp.]|nr:PCRF domain-containing protein [Ruminococcus sp.]